MELIIVLVVVFVLYRLLFGGSSSKVYRDRKGYYRFKDSGKPVHRWAAEKKLGRRLRRGEVVHHRNRNKRDNRRSNLWVFPSQKDHDRAHKKDAKRFGKKASYSGSKRRKR